MQPFLEQYLHAKINISYTTGLSQVAQDMVMGKPADGLNLGVFNTNTDLIDTYFKVPLGFDLNSVSLIGATKNVPSVAAACGPNPPWTKAEDLITGNVAAKALGVYPGSSYLGQILLLSAYKVPFKMLTGYTGATVNAACARGDGNFTIGSLPQVVNSAGTSMIPGVTPLLLSGEIPAGAPQTFLNSTVPTLAQFSKTNPPKTEQGEQALNLALRFFNTNVPTNTTFGPAGIPANRLLALTDAWAKAAAQPAVKQAYLQIGVSAGFFYPADIQAYIKSGLAALPEVQSLAGVKSS